MEVRGEALPPKEFDEGLLRESVGGVTIACKSGNLSDLPLTDRLFIDVLIAGGIPMVETDDTDDASESLPLRTALKRFEVVELCLFFFGIGGRTFPGNSVRNFL